jgi:hypothetical protein
MADRLGIESLDREGRAVVLRFRAQANLDPVRLVALVGRRGDLTLVPPAALRLSLDGAGGRLPGAGKATSHQPPATRHQPPASPRKSGARSQAAAPSWWTARARAGEVTPGFSKEEMLKPTHKEDPRAPGGVLERVGGVLSDLLDQG